MRVPISGAARTLFIVCAFLMAAPFSNVMAQDQQLVDYRKSVLSALDAHMNAVEAVVADKVKFRHHVSDHAIAIVGGSRSLLELFPEKVATASIKQDGAAPLKDTSPFVAAATQFNGEAARFVQALSTGDPDKVEAQFNSLNKAYKSLQAEIN